MSFDVFIISAISADEPSEAIRLAMESASVPPARVQDLVFSSVGSITPELAIEISQQAGLGCTTISVSSSLRALFFAAQSVLSGDVDLVIVLDRQASISTAFLLASPDAVGRMNLVPRARIAARSIVGPVTALRIAEITNDEVAIHKDGQDDLQSVKALVEELEAKQAQWGMLTSNELVLLVERI